MTIPEFIAKWRKVELKERSAAQEHFLDLCHVFEHPTPAAADPTGENFCFEKGAAKHAGGDGFADVWKRGFFCFEYKGKHKDLAAAYDQLLRYRNALENPPLLVVCDLDRIIVHTNFTGTVSATHEIQLENLTDSRNIGILRAVFHNPEALHPARTSVAVTQDAARQFAEIADAMRKPERGLDPAAVAHFLDRIVFCLFAEDTRLLPEMVFSRIVKNSGGDPARFGKILGQLFDTMATGGDFGLEPVRHFNGNLFEDRSVLDLTADEVRRIAAAADLDWSAVDPSIFGTLFERGLDPAKRSQLGAHFTGRDDIELVVDAVMMSVLRREWNECRATIDSLLATGRKTPAPGGAGVPPASAKTARGWHSRGYLPHFDHYGLVQTITFRLADSLPAELAGRLSQSREKSGDAELRKEIEESLDHALGACHLRDLRVADIVQNALLHFDGTRYRLLTWVIMPNHVHVMIETLPGIRLDEVIHSWKSFTAKECNRLLDRTGPFWQEDYFDRFIRDGEHFRKARDYIERNPVKAGLVRKPEAWRFSSAGSHQDAGGTPAPPGMSAAAMKKARGEAGSILHRFLDRLQRVRVLDPACGSGNFLYMALLRLKDLEKEAILYGNDNGLGSFLPMVGPWQLHGIEINPYAHDLAQMTVWIGWLQWIRVNGFGFPGDPILRPLTDNIRLMDAIVSDNGEPEWPAVDFIIGNPPFLGGKMLRREMGDAYVERIFASWRGRVPHEADLCCYWFEKTRAHIAAGKCKRAGLLATQGIRGGANREVLKRIKETGGIFWAESDRPWILDGANVHVSMIGFDDGTEKTHILDGNVAETINSNLSSAAADITHSRKITGNQNIAFMGTTKGGCFDIEEALALTHILSPNPHGRPNSDMVVPWVNGMDLTQRGRGKWIIDFGVGLPMDDAAKYQEPFEYVREKVKPDRDKNARESYRRLWWQHVEARPAMRESLSPLARFLVTPTIAKHRIFSWRAAPTLPDHQLIVFARSDDYFFGVLHSRFHEVWALAQGSQLREKESGFRYTPTTCFETFPFPFADDTAEEDPLEFVARLRAAHYHFGQDNFVCEEPPPAAPSEHHAAIAAAAKELNELRENWLNPPEWTREEVMEFPGTVGGPWDRFIDPATATDRGAFKVGTVRYPRLVARDAACAARLKERTLTKLYNARPAWLAACHAQLDAAVAAAYGWPADLTDEAILERLLALNQAAAP